MVVGLIGSEYALEEATADGPTELWANADGWQDRSDGAIGLDWASEESMGIEGLRGENDSTRDSDKESRASRDDEQAKDEGYWPLAYEE